ncbi:hypothetical protein S245_067029 [Arachis hypogaea]|uniref:Uncharacterized protein n=1 Tax=Arachis hypogaea TaxID=3818 RepID=A0A6B9VCL8_ARAHY|nr:uncharacterized protein DS421_19g657890 [Arachis hypogaea]
MCEARDKERNKVPRSSSRRGRLLSPSSRTAASTLLSSRLDLALDSVGSESRSSNLRLQSEGRGLAEGATTSSSAIELRSLGERVVILGGFYSDEKKRNERFDGGRK